MQCQESLALTDKHLLVYSVMVMRTWETGLQLVRLCGMAIRLLSHLVRK